ncbi:MAG TPA: hypothetical protein DDY91_03980 [Planctomycetaceae bacterium]|nr:hypothetical protein [Planctomycetaceae bacterium]
MTSHPDDPMDSRHALPEHSLPGRLPDFVVVGATKSGTTSLYYYLDQHPEIGMSWPKEPRYFLDPEFGNYHRGEAWYRDLFRTPHRLCGEATPAYTHQPNCVVAERMHNLIPRARLIYLVREPWSRLVSHYRMLRSSPNTPNGTPAEILRKRPRARLASLYGTHWNCLTKYFPADQLLLVESNHLLSATRDTMRTIFEFLGVDPHFDSRVFDRKFHKAETRDRRLARSPEPQTNPGMAMDDGVPGPNVDSSASVIFPPELIRELHDEFHREVDLLRQLTGQPFPSLDLPPLERLLAEHT